MPLHLVKLCVGVDSVEALEAWREQVRGREPEWRLRTRQTPRRAEDLLAGGSVYRVIKGQILCRQAILGIETVGQGAAARCEIVLDPVVVRTAPAPRRAFQGWRYLEAKDAPEDLAFDGPSDALPSELAIRLREIGAW